MVNLILVTFYSTFVYANITQAAKYVADVYMKHCSIICSDRKLDVSIITKMKHLITVVGHLKINTKLYENRKYIMIKKAKHL